VFSPLVCLGIYEHDNHLTKTIALRSPERGGLGPIENELWSGSVEVRKQTNPMD